MTEQRLGILGGMGRPTRLAPCGDPGDLICSGQMNCPSAKVFASGENTCTAHQRRRSEDRSDISIAQILTVPFTSEQVLYRLLRLIL